MLKVNSKSKIFILTPSGGMTGGPESLHYLAEKLRELGHDARLVYWPHEKRISLSSYYLYKFCEASQVEDSDNNILVVPEVWIDKLRLFKRIQKSIWWLSVDNYFVSGQTFNFEAQENSRVVHLAQSFYVEKFLRENKAKNVFKLQAALNRSFYKKRIFQNSRGNVIYFNPQKGADYTNLLRRKLPNLSWIPIANKKRRRVADLLRVGKVYVDFGPHPGRDRLPREAVLCGCCVIVGRRGSAQYYEDVPIPDEYKFSIEVFDVDRICSKIMDCMNGYEQRVRDFEHFRRHVCLEPHLFGFSAEYIFGRQANVLRMYRMALGFRDVLFRFLEISFDYLRSHFRRHS